MLLWGILLSMSVGSERVGGVDRVVMGWVCVVLGLVWVVGLLREVWVWYG